MKLDNFIIHLIGFAGVGKYTIAKELVQISGARLVDNHLLNNPVFNVIDLKNGGKLDKEVWEQIRKIRMAVMDTIRTISPSEYSFIFTNCLFESDPDDHKLLGQFKELADDRSGYYVPVRLFCDEQENTRRKSNEQRLERMKPINTNNIARLHAEEEIIHIDHPNVFNLNVTDLSAHEAAMHIMQHCSSLLPSPATQPRHTP